MKRVAEYLPIDTVSFLVLMSLSTCDRYMLYVYVYVQLLAIGHCDRNALILQVRIG